MARFGRKGVLQSEAIRFGLLRFGVFGEFGEEGRGFSLLGVLAAICAGIGVGVMDGVHLELGLLPAFRALDVVEVLGGVEGFGVEGYSGEFVFVGVCLVGEEWGLGFGGDFLD
jgi:hypothetical protein